MEILLLQSRHLFHYSVCSIHVSNNLFRFDALYHQDKETNNEIIYIDPLLTLERETERDRERERARERDFLETCTSERDLS